MLAETAIDAAWRTGNAGRLLYAATDLFVRDKLHIVYGSGAAKVTAVHMALVQNLDLNGTRLTLIAARARMTKQSMRELIDKAELLGLVSRLPDPDDRRAKIVVFTQAGLEVMERLRLGVAAAERRLAFVTPPGFLASMKRGLTAYALATSDDAPVLHHAGAASWRTHNAGRLLSAAANVFSEDVLATRDADGFPEVTAVHLSLIRNLDVCGTRLTTIAARARMTKQAMAELVDKMEAMGLVMRKPDPDDHRAKTVAFTPAGLRMLDRLRYGVQRGECRLASVTGAAFVAELRAGLTAYLASEDRLAHGTSPLLRAG